MEVGNQSMNIFTWSNFCFILECRAISSHSPLIGRYGYSLCALILAIIVKYLSKIHFIVTVEEEFKWHLCAQSVRACYFSKLDSSESLLQYVYSVSGLRTTSWQLHLVVSISGEGCSIGYFTNYTTYLVCTKLCILYIWYVYFNQKYILPVYLSNLMFYIIQEFIRTMSNLYNLSNSITMIFL